MLDEYAIVGELALDGSTRPVKGALSMAMAAAASSTMRRTARHHRPQRERGAKRPSSKAIDVIAVDSLAQTVAFLAGELEIEPTPSRLDELFQELSHYDEDFADVRGQEMAKRAVTIAAAGGHNLLMVGPPGSGKTMLAKRVPTILPAAIGRGVDRNDAHLQRDGPPASRASRCWPRGRFAPHHTIAMPAWSAADRRPRPAKSAWPTTACSFSTNCPSSIGTTLEVLRQPLEDGHVTISRALNSTTFPANFVLIASLNPCPCGYRNDPRRECHCTVPQIERYMAKISGPLLDRIDLHIEVPAVPFKELSGSRDGHDEHRDARPSDRRPGCASGPLLELQDAPQRRDVDPRDPRSTANSPMPARICCGPASRKWASRPGPTTKSSASPARSPISTARAEILPEHVSEAVNYRMLDRQFWS